MNWPMPMSPARARSSAPVMTTRETSKSLCWQGKPTPTVRVVARLANDVLREAVADDNGPGAILDVADLAAPSVVEACLAHTTHPFEAAGIEFVVSGAETPYDATLREIYGDLAPVAVIHGKNSPTPGEVVPCPGRDLRVHAGDWTSMIGTTDELAARGIKVPRPTATRSDQPWVRRIFDAARALRDDVNPMFFPALAIALILILGSTVVVALLLHPPGCPGSTRCTSPARRSRRWATATSASPIKPHGCVCSASI